MNDHGFSLDADDHGRVLDDLFAAACSRAQGDELARLEATVASMAAIITADVHPTVLADPPWEELGGAGWLDEITWRDLDSADRFTTDAWDDRHEAGRVPAGPVTPISVTGRRRSRRAALARRSAAIVTVATLASAAGAAAMGGLPRVLDVGGVRPRPAAIIAPAAIERSLAQRPGRSSTSGEALGDADGTAPSDAGRGEVNGNASTSDVAAASDVGAPGGQNDDSQSDTAGLGTGDSPAEAAPQVGPNASVTVPDQDSGTESDTAPGQSKPDPSKTAPGQSKPDPSNTAPGQSKPDPSETTPGQPKAEPSDAEPGQSNPGAADATPGHSGSNPSTTAPGQTRTNPSTTAPGHTKDDPSDTAPGQTGATPSATAPGQTGATPSATAPGHEGATPSATAPGQTGATPSATAPGHAGNEPSATAPGQVGNTTPSSADDRTPPPAGPDHGRKGVAISRLPDAPAPTVPAGAVGPDPDDAAIAPPSATLPA